MHSPDFVVQFLWANFIVPFTWHKMSESADEDIANLISYLFSVIYQLTNFDIFPMFSSL